MGENKTGLPEPLKAGIEAVAGVAMDGVKVHYNSSRPREVQALAYAQGREIHLGPGQDKYLPHEAWHVAQQRQGRVAPLQQNKGVAVNDDIGLEREASSMGLKASRAVGAKALKVGRESPPMERGQTSGVVQRVIPGLEEIKIPDDIPDGWIDLYVDDITDHHTHLYDQEIIQYLDQADPGWHGVAELVNTGGNHWDVRLLGSGITIRTAPDGNCGIHAIHAVLKRDKFLSDVDGHSAPASMINYIRDRIKAVVANDRDEIKARILLEIQRNHSSFLTGFGPLLREVLEQREASALEAMEGSESFQASIDSAGGAFEPQVDLGSRRYRRFIRLMNEKVPSDFIFNLMRESGMTEKESLALIEAHKPGVTRSEDVSKADLVGKGDKIREKVLALENELMDLVDFEQDEMRFLADLKKALYELKVRPKSTKLAEARKQASELSGVEAQQAEGEVEKLELDFNAWKEQLRVDFEKYKKRSKKSLEENASQLEQLTPKRQEWMSLMAQLCGTHEVSRSGGSEGSRGLTQRHDSVPGGYGRPPKEEDQFLDHRLVEVLHGHGGWHRTGLLTRGLLDQEMPGLTSLGEIVERANLIRRGRKMMELPPDKVDLAFVDHHGSTIMMDRVIRGAYPDLMPLPVKLHKEVVDLMEKAKEAGEEPEDYIRRRCGRGRVDPGKKRYAEKRGERYVPDWEWKNLDLWNAYQRVQKGTASGKRAEYVDVLEAETHGPVKFPDSLLGHLMGLDQGERAMKENELPGYHASTLMDFKGVDWNSVCIRLSDAVVERLAAIETVDRPVRIVWAACRSEQWPKGFSDIDFLQWIKDAAAVRREAAAKMSED